MDFIYKISAIKKVREMTGCGLKEAKDAVEAIEPNFTGNYELTHKQFPNDLDEAGIVFGRSCTEVLTIRDPDIIKLLFIISQSGSEIVQILRGTIAPHLRDWVNDKVNRPSLPPGKDWDAIQYRFFLGMRGK